VFCDATYVKREGKGSRRTVTCENRATFHYRSTSGAIVNLCGRHSGSEAHRWKNPRPIQEAV
jgi:hypothetical protein